MLVQLTTRYTDAFDYARTAHAGQVRKGTTVPYLAHLLGVSSLVLDHGGDEDHAIGGLLHDVVEDCGEIHAERVRERFGARVADIVLGCTDATSEAKRGLLDAEAKRADWRMRKQRYLVHLETASNDTLLVSGCDKLHNLRAIVADLRQPDVGATVFDRFTGSRDGTLWYYAALVELFARRRHPAVTELQDALNEVARNAVPA